MGRKASPSKFWFALVLVIKIFFSWSFYWFPCILPFLVSKLEFMGPWLFCNSSENRLELWLSEHALSRDTLCWAPSLTSQRKKWSWKYKQVILMMPCIYSSHLKPIWSCFHPEYIFETRYFICSNLKAICNLGNAKIHDWS